MRDKLLKNTIKIFDHVKKETFFLRKKNSHSYLLTHIVECCPTLAPIHKYKYYITKLLIFVQYLFF